MSDDRRLMNSQQNDVFRLVEAREFDPREFEWSERAPGAAYLISHLRHVPSESWIDFDYVTSAAPSGSGYMVTFSPGSETKEQTKFPGSWESTKNWVDTWLGNTQREMAEPSLWQQLAGGEPLLEAPALAVENTPFRPDEVAAIDQKLDQVLAYVRAELPPGGIPMIEGMIERLREDSRKTGRVTWMQLAIGTFVSLTWGGLMAPHEARHIIDLIGQAFQALITG